MGQMPCPRDHPREDDLGVDVILGVDVMVANRGRELESWRFMANGVSKHGTTDIGESHREPVPGMGPARA